jgi:hypothetical protein
MVRVYKYGLLPPSQGGETVAEQMRAAHRYQNQLIEIERTRRATIRAVLGGHDTVSPLEAQVATLTEALTATREAIRASRSEHRTRAIPAALAEEATRLKAERTAARAALRQAKRALRLDPTIQAAIAEATRTAAAQRRAARAACGVYWGSYLTIERAVDATRTAPVDPHFRRWTGEGSVAVQLQHGLDVDAVLAAADTRLQIDLRPQPVPKRPRRDGQPRTHHGRPLPRVRVRIGSEGRRPVWAEWPLVYHRPLPPNGRVLWAQVHRRRVASREVWDLCVTVEESTPETPAGDRVVAVDLGWRRTDAESLRAGRWTNGIEAADILLDVRHRTTLRKVEDLRSIRDQQQNEIHLALVEWRAAQDILSPELSDRLLHLPQWKSPARFAALAHWWRDHRQPGDETIYPALEAWRQRDKHLWWWEAHARRRALLRRREQYRRLAADLAARHDVLVIERLNLSELARIPAPDETRESHPRARSQRVETAPSELRLALVQAFQARGKRVVTVAATGPAETLWACYRERQGVEAIVETARISRFKRLVGSAVARDGDPGPQP